MAHRTPILALWVALGVAGAALGAGSAAAQTPDAPAAAPAPASSKPAPHPVKRAAKRRASAPAAPSVPAEAATGSYQLVPSGGSSLARARAGSFGAVDEPAPPGYRKRSQLGIGLGGANGTTPGMSLGF